MADHQRIRPVRQGRDFGPEQRAPGRHAAGSSIAGHHTSSMVEKSCSGQHASSSVRGVPMSQAKA